MFARKLVAALPAAIARRCPLAKCSRPRELACFETLAWSGSRWCCKHDVGRAAHVREGTDSSAGLGRCAAHPASENWQPQALFESPCLGGRLARRQQHTSQPFNRAVPQPHVLSRVLAPTLSAMPCTARAKAQSGSAKLGTHSEACLRVGQNRNSRKSDPASDAVPLRLGKFKLFHLGKFMLCREASTVPLSVVKLELV